ncbi:unnamed protein product [Orchesella dallaii]|uniref:39S ribosomal protein L12, mitochondrial n=1 Tax=Orchesella dallaii TaxID=48710 RepID=A0ABP1PQY4_9HEXA
MSRILSRRILALSSHFQVQARTQFLTQCKCASYSTISEPQSVKRGPTPLEPVNEAPLPVTSPVGEAKVYEPKIVKLVEEISQLTLLQVADLNELLKKTLNIPDAPMMGAMAFAAPAAAAAEEEEAAAPQKVQTSFTLKLMKFDESKKVPLIKECKSLLEGMNLVQAKKFVESAPCVVKADISKDDAEKLKTALEAAGATCEIS